MNLIKYISDSKIEPSLPEDVVSDDWQVRITARAVLIDDQNRIALMHIAKFNTYKLPGGGVDPGEDLDSALHREILEETGCTSRKLSEIGITIEKRDRWHLFQISHCYLAQVVSLGNSNLTEEEISAGFSLKWIQGAEEVIKLINQHISDDYDSQFMRLRDSAIIAQAINLL